MNLKNIFLTVAFAILIGFLPFFPNVSELRSYSADGHSLSLEWSVGSVADYIEWLKYNGKAWGDRVWMITILLGFFNVALCLVLASLCSFCTNLFWRKLNPIKE